MALSWLWLTILVLNVSHLCYCDSSSARGDKLATGDPRTPSEYSQNLNIIRNTGFKAEIVNVTTSDGYILGLIHVENPAITNRSGLEDKKVVLFVHGELTSAGCFAANPGNIEPRDYSRRKVKGRSQEDLRKELQGDSVANSLLYLLSAYGNDVWLLNRRGSAESLGHIYLEAYKSGASRIVGQVYDEADVESCDQVKTTDPERDLSNALSAYEKTVGSNYWSYSQDEQANKDLPEVIDFILKKTGKEKLAIVAHSSGGAITLMMSIDHQEYAKKISTSILLSPALYALSESDPFGYPAVASQSALMKYTGPLSSDLITEKLFCLEAATCISKYNVSVCSYKEQQPEDTIGDNPVAYQMYKNADDVSSSRQEVQLLQVRSKSMMHRYDFGSIWSNLLHYGTFWAPVYKTSQVNLKNVHIFNGKDDVEVTPDDISRLIKDLTIPVDHHYIDDPKLFFRHSSPIVHEYVATLVNIPALDAIESES